MLDVEKSNLEETDMHRRNTIATLLSDWGLLQIQNKEQVKDCAPLRQIKIIGYNFNIYADGKFLTNVKTSTTFNIKPFQTSEIEFDATINPDTIGGITNALINSQKIKDISLKTEGTITIKKFGMPIRVPISYTETIGDYMK